MKARVIATGEIVELNPYCEVYEKQKEPFKSKKHKICHLEGIEIFNDPDYWERLKHQYAGIAMQTMLATLYNPKYHKELMACYTEVDAEEVARLSKYYAHALVEKLKKEEKK